MYKLVTTLQEEALYHAIWTKVWLEKGFELEFASEVLGRCLVYDEHGVPVATAEIKPYDPAADQGLNRLVPFAQHPAIITEPEYTAEVDKVALLKEYRGKNLNRLLSSIVLFARDHHIRHYVTLLDPILSRALKISFHVPMSKVGTSFFYKGANVIPAIIHVAEIYENKPRFDWYLDALPLLTA
ncbi:hypothetical protein EHV15_10080 [Paenibacillus oralis]|uniref:N-acetyltransferase domain-containing protein n=1 Tax=Paenibacillus oralis TaxID=2490856 RepID=A0A3P3U0X3_9BACL|nr:GNAT family N-acetyltransferase [Paenibacillus oralis]RRJ63228.1 hypothetical protein EHV15_10080 [Paenibacillus oralis]